MCAADVCATGAVRDFVEDLRADRFELAADGITVRPERSVSGRFSVPIARGGAVLLVRRASPSAPIRRRRAGLDEAFGLNYVALITHYLSSATTSATTSSGVVAPGAWRRKLAPE